MNDCSLLNVNIYKNRTIRKTKMKIAIPKETYSLEKRIMLTPIAIKELTSTLTI